MSYFRLLSGRKSQEDRRSVFSIEASMGTKDYRALYEGTFPSDARKRETTPLNARTFAEHSIVEARRICDRRPHVVIRDDPMFGRRGFAREVIPDKAHGYLILVIAFSARKDERGNWKEPHRAKPAERQYWPPGKVEFV